MNRTIFQLSAFIVALFTTAGAFAGLSADASVDQILDALHDVGKDLKSFTADVRMSETDTFAQQTSTRIGQIWYQRKDDGDTRWRVTFTKRIKDGLSEKQWLEYKLDRGWLTERIYGRKQEINRQVLKPGERINLLKLGEGPFPLPIGQAKADVYKQFDVKKLPPAKEDPADTVHLALSPKPGSQLERKFSEVDVWVNLQTAMPKRIDTVDRNGVDARSTELDKLSINPQMDDSNFVLPDIASDGWQRRDEPFSE